MTRAEKKAADIADLRIENAYRAKCSGIQINVLDIAKIFDYGRLKIAEGLDDEALAASIAAYVHTIRQN